MEVFITGTGGSASKSVFILGVILDNKETKFCVEVGGKHFIATPLNKEAVQKVKMWHRDYFDLRKKELLDSLLPILEDKKNFELIDEQKEAYKLCCEYTRRRPIKSFELLKEWFNNDFEKKKEEFIKTSFETSPETMLQFEIEITQKEIEYINREYFGIYPPNAVNKVAQRLGERLIKKNPIHITVYLKWLKERVEVLSNQKNDVEPTANRIKWNSSPYHFGFIINELINKGYIGNTPMHNGETNYSEIARMFGSIIDFDTSDQNLTKSFNPNNEKISETVKSKFTIPECKDIKPKNNTSKVLKKQSLKKPIKPKEKR